MLKIGMCDDNLESLQVVAKLLESEIIEQGLDAEITLITSDQKKIFDAIYNNELDILFLDIDFKTKGKNGIEFAKDLREVNRTFYLIFLTAHQRYVHLSFVVKVYDYLFKPINRAIIEDLVSRLKKDYSRDQNVFLHLSRWKSIQMNSILYIERIGNRSHIITNTNEELTTKSLDTLLNELTSNFKRCHRSYIVNTEKIIGIDRKKGIVILSNNKSCPINNHFNL
ncbi:MAG: LytTR family DNA-binding domain-containing protein [Clostridia bacterium]|nr:LytTR family DNA-binding domain-containing protein [Clostridia bacterium]